MVDKNVKKLNLDGQIKDTTESLIKRSQNTLNKAFDDKLKDEIEEL